MLRGAQGLYVKASTCTEVHRGSRTENKQDTVAFHILALVPAAAQQVVPDMAWAVKRKQGQQASQTVAENDMVTPQIEGEGSKD